MVNIAKKVKFSDKNNFSYTVKKPEYKKSNEVKTAEKNLKKWEKNKPDEYKSAYSDEIDKILADILNREDFSYSPSSDPLYEQYKELYSLNGKKAMMDTVGNASSLTGGYNSSYAVTAGKQAYDEYMTRINDIALDLRDRAYEEYSDKGDKLLEDVNILRSLDGDEYEKYLDSVDRYYKDGEYLLEKLANMTDAEFEAFSAELKSWENDRAFAFDVYQDKLDRKEFDEELAYKKAEAQRDQKNKDRNYQLALKKATASSSKSYSSSSKSSSSSKKKAVEKEKEGMYPLTYNEFVSRTGVSAILTFEEFKISPDYIKAYSGKYTDYLEEMYDKYKK